MTNITIYKLQLIKEQNIKYEISNIISSPNDAYQNFLKVFNPECETEEIFMLFCLNTKNKITAAFEVSRGNLNSSIVHPREVYKRAITANANSIIVSHNHPSGDCAISQEDINITKRLIEAGKIIGIELLDHIIIGDGKYISLKEKGII